MPEPDASIVVCTLNEETRIGSCLRRLRDQDYAGAYEIIVADGCSDDRTGEIVREMGVRLVLEQKRSIAAERQAGANAAVAVAVEQTQGGFVQGEAFDRTGEGDPKFLVELVQMGEVGPGLEDDLIESAEANKFPRMTADRWRGGGTHIIVGVGHA